MRESREREAARSWPPPGRSSGTGRSADGRASRLGVQAVGRRVQVECVRGTSHCFAASGTGLDDALQWILPKRGKATAACSSAVRFGEISPGLVSGGGLEHTKPRIFPDSALEYAGGGEIPCSGISCAHASGHRPSPCQAGSPSAAPGLRAQAPSRRDCRAPAQSTGALPVGYGSRRAVQRAPRSADLWTWTAAGVSPRRAVAAGPESARDIRRSARIGQPGLVLRLPRISGALLAREDGAVPVGSAWADGDKRPHTVLPDGY